ncbi:hypothetical protein HLB23_24310 [Nocardia uniformis]|uniref:Uncharacterized protein n=1 Tax=Nocardia uniformis TaxID=53432 RepID=A0A849C2Q5_9NOCA|nr:hypothetical protein [Nocardia uniformis]NNH72944.1 hypothetical protein [Nocardia uniformis]
MLAVPAVLGSVAKDGRDPGDNDDRAGAGLYRFAVADGAATSARPEIWAEILVHAYVGEHVDPFETNELAALREQWLREVVRPGLPWHATEKLKRGGAATFVGLDINLAARRYRAVAVGDSCLLHLREARLVRAGPLGNWELFDRFPPLVSTLAGDESFRTALWRKEGAFEPGDVFILASDALAKYLLRSHAQDQQVDMAPCTARTADLFAEWVTKARSQSGLDNDDTTICVVTP